MKLCKYFDWLICRFSGLNAVLFNTFISASWQNLENILKIVDNKFNEIELKEFANTLQNCFLKFTR